MKTAKVTSVSHSLRILAQFYVDVLLDACGALRQASISYGSKIHSVLLGPGLGDLVHFLCALFHDSRIINPDIREALLKAIAAMMQYPVSPSKSSPAKCVVILTVVGFLSDYAALFLWGCGPTQ